MKPVASRFVLSAALAILIPLVSCGKSQTSRNDDAKNPPAPDTTSNGSAPPRDSAPLSAQERGNGGLGIACKDASGALTRVRTLDLFEGESVYGHTYAKLAGTDPWVLARERIQALVKQSELPWLGVLRGLENVRENFRLSAPGVVLEPTRDGAPIALPVGCESVQLANFVDSSTVVVARDLWEVMPVTEQAALLVHEAVYAFERGARGAKDGRFSRKLTAALFADASPFEPVTQMYGTPGSDGIPGAIKCEGFDASQEKSYTFALREENAILTFEVLEAGGVPYSKETVACPGGGLSEIVSGKLAACGGVSQSTLMPARTFIFVFSEERDSSKLAHKVSVLLDRPGDATGPRTRIPLTCED